jgi:hypothetical protein
MIRWLYLLPHPSYPPSPLKYYMETLYNAYGYKPLLHVKI